MRGLMLSRLLLDGHVGRLSYSFRACSDIPHFSSSMFNFDGDHLPTLAEWGYHTNCTHKHRMRKKKREMTALSHRVKIALYPNVGFNV